MNGVNPFVLYIVICVLAALGIVTFVWRARGNCEDGCIVFNRNKIKGE